MGTEKEPTDRPHSACTCKTRLEFRYLCPFHGLDSGVCISYSISGGTTQMLSFPFSIYPWLRKCGQNEDQWPWFHRWNRGYRKRAGQSQGHDKANNEVGERGKRKAKLGSTSWKSAESMRIKHTREERVRGSGSGGWNEYLPSAGEEKACFPPVSFAKSIFEGSCPEQPLRLDAP